jgi:flagellar protein FlaF
MGFATSIAISIFFIAIMLIATVTYPVIFHSTTSIRDSINDKHKLQMSRLNTHINIMSATQTGGNINITLSNRGSTVLNANKSDILVDGNYTSYIVSPSGLWLPGKNAVFSVNADAATNHTLKIITENGISAYWEV